MVASVASSGARDRVEGGEVGLEGRARPAAPPSQRGGDGGGHGGHAGDVVPEVWVGIAAGDVEHLRRVDDAWVPAVRAEERAHPGVVAGTVLDHDLRLGQRGGVCGVRLEEVGVGIGARDERGDLDVAPAELAGDVAPEVLGCHDVHDADVPVGVRRAAHAPARPRVAAARAAPARAGRSGLAGSHNGNGNHFG